jgi:hypothetical protein
MLIPVRAADSRELFSRAEAPRSWCPARSSNSAIGKRRRALSAYYAYGRSVLPRVPSLSGARCVVDGCMLAAV